MTISLLPQNFLTSNSFSDHDNHNGFSIMSDDDMPSEEVVEVFSQLGDLEKEFADVELSARKRISFPQHPTLTTSQSAAKNSTFVLSTPSARISFSRSPTFGLQCSVPALKNSSNSSPQMTSP
jgi:hypothetical protein